MRCAANSADVGIGYPGASLLRDFGRMMRMQYAILCYHDEQVTCNWSKEQDDAVMAKLAVVQERLTSEGKLGPVARLLPTTAATTLRKDRDPPLIIDGPFAETKEQLLGFYVIDCGSLEEVLEIAAELGRANPGGAYEIRPIGLFLPGKAAP
jgi:hypothetical protein